MNSSKIAALLAVLVCIAVLVFSYLTWQDRLDQAVASPESGTESEQAGTAQPTDGQLVENSELFANMGEQVQEMFLRRISEGEAVRLLIAGSAALESGEPGYAEHLKEALEKAYGESIDVTIESISGTSDSLQHLTFKTPYDLVLLEPMTLMNNDRLSIEEEREDIRDFTERLQAANAEALVVLHPPQPIYRAGYYRAQVQALQEFSNLYGYPYIDHWDAWPATDDETLKEHLTADALPNSRGAEVWASELIDYFIAN